ncbi:MAG: hypothetical protein MUF34_08735 [Polyangiaceae bacterium]|jgi:hypothetical protein|nr:hypothetical protein [Polyangiaceae bacterium]
MKVAFDPTLRPSAEGGAVEAARSRETAALPQRAVARVRDVAARRTPLSTAEIRAAVGVAYERSTGRPAPEGALRVLTAHVSLETAHGQRMFNYNFGGIKGASPEGTTARYQTHEVFAGKRVQLEQPFRAYADPASGASDYLNLLRKRYPDAVAAAERGDARAFAEKLGRAGYFTAPASEYAAAMDRLSGAEGGLAPADGPLPLVASASSLSSVASAFSSSSSYLARASGAAADVGPVLPLDGAELSLVLDALAAAGAARIAAPEQEESA